MRKKILICVLVFLCGFYIRGLLVPDIKPLVSEMEAMQQEVIQERLAVERLSAQLWLLEKAVE